jgi:MSHA biogenesis protein MshM
MYLEHFGLRELPFSLTPDTSYFFAHSHHQDALNTLLVALKNGEGFIKVTGEVGTGKTLLCRKLLNLLGDEYRTAYIPNPFLTPSALIHALGDELGLQLPRNLGQHRALREITNTLIALAGDGKQVVLIIDEAQAMPDETMEALRLLTNLETEKRKLLHVVMFGQPELNQRLSEPNRRQLLQRITFSCDLKPFDLESTAAYVHHRLTVAGSNGSIQFRPEAMKMLYQASNGFPRLINILAHKSLLLGYGQGKQIIEADHMKSAISDTESAALRKDRALGWVEKLLMIIIVVLVVAIVAYAVSAPGPLLQQVTP